MPWSWSQLAFVPPPPEVEERSSSYSISDPMLAVMLGYSSADGVTVSECTAMTLSAVFRAVSIVANSIASLPLRTLSEGEDGRKTRSASVLDRPDGADGLTPFEWKQLVMIHLLLHGNAYLQHVYNGAGALIALHPIHPHCVHVEWDDSRPGRKLFKIRDGDKTLKLDASTMTQIMGPSLDGLTGLGVVAQARLSLGTALQGDKAAHKLFANGALISGMVTPEGEEPWEEDDAKTIKASIVQNVTGPENAGGVAVFDRGLKFSPWTMTAIDAQFLQSRAFSVEEVGRWFGVPPHLLGQVEKQTSWGTGVAEQNLGLSRYTLSGWTHPIEERMDRVIPPGKYAEFDYSEFLQSSPAEEITLLIAEMNGGLITPNEARRIRNMPPIAGGDVLRVPTGSQSLADASTGANQGNDNKGVTQ